MKKPLDKVSEAYFGEMGEEFGQTTRDRIHWVCEQATGEQILDIGCSQGITDIILGREGKKVFAIDILEESIDYAKKLLEDESEVTKTLVDFQAANFMTHDFKEDKFDVVILAEVLEHVTEPTRFLRKSMSLLHEGGKVIVTLPFGVNDFFDHKKTYYVTGVLDMLPNELKVASYKFLGNYLCFTLEQETEGVSLYSFFSDAEKNFYVKERSLVESRKKNLVENERLLDENQSLSIKYEDANGKVDELEDMLISYKQQQLELKDKKRLEKEFAEQAEILNFERQHSNNLNLTLHELEKELVRVTESRKRAAENYKNKSDYADKLKQKVTELEKELVQLTESKDRSIKNYKNKSDHADKLEHDLLKLQQELVNLTEAKERASMNYKSKSDHVDKLKQKVAELQKELESKEKAIKSYKNKSDQVERFKEELMRVTESKEKAIKSYENESDHVDKLKQKLMEQENELKRVTESKERAVGNYKNKSEYVDKLKQKLADPQQDRAQLTTQMERLIVSRKEKLEAEKLLLTSYKKEQNLLKSYSRLQESYQGLVKERDILEKRYNSLRNSRLGKATVAYWQWRKK